MAKVTGGKPAAKAATTTARKPAAPAPAARAPRAPAPAPRPAAPAAVPAVRNERAGAVGPVLNYGSHGRGTGLEDADRDSFAIPFIQVLQKMSPQLDRNNAAFIDGAAEGDFLNTASLEVYDGQEGILVAPVKFKRSFTAWIIREKGGGFKGEYAVDDPVVMTTQADAKNRNILPGTEIQLVDTRLHGCILLSGDVPTPALLSLTSTQIKKSKRWNSYQSERSQKDDKPIFAHVYRITTIPEHNDQGSWMGVQIDPVDDVQDQAVIDTAMGFYESLRTGAKKMQADPGQTFDQQ